MTDEEFLIAFETRTIEALPHRDHIKVAYLYLRRHSLDEAMLKVRAGLQALAVAWNAPVDDLEHGYHETITQAWVRLVHLTLIEGGTAENADAFCNRHPRLLHKSHLHLFYSPERLKTWEAKRGFIEPDLAPLRFY